MTSSSDTWWRVGPAIAASGRFVLAPDLPGHGRTTGDIRAKAEALTQYEVNAARAVVLENTFDAGLAALAGPAGADVRIWFIRGQAATGSLIPEERVPELVERVGADHVLTIAGGPHSPQRTHPEATVLAILRALEG